MATIQVAKGVAVRQSWLARLQNSNAFNGYLFILPTLVGLAVFQVYPLISSAYLSLTSGNLLGAAKWVGLDNYRLLFQDSKFWISLKNTGYYTFAMLLPSVAIAIALALAMNQKLKGIVFFRFLLFLPTITSSVAVSIMWMWLYNSEFGVLNQLLKAIGFFKLFGIKRILWLGAPETAMLSIIIMAIWRGLGYNMLLFLAALQDIPEVYYEAAKIDGAGAWSRFWRITLPLISPMTFFVIIMMIIGGFQVFEYSYVMTGGQGGPVYSTLTMVLYLYQEGFQSFRIGYASALAYVLFALIMVLTVIQFRFQKAWVFYE